jgi:hypothetical protein
MEKLHTILSSLPRSLQVGDVSPFPQSFIQKNGSVFLMIRNAQSDFLVICGPESTRFSGQPFDCDGVPSVLAPLSHENARVLRSVLPFTAPSRILGRKRTFGVGDRLGIAGPGHLRVFSQHPDVSPVLAQQSVRELTLTRRNFAEVLDSATYAVFREGYTGGYGADGDHLKKPEEVKNALEAGFTMITLDCSEHIRNDVAAMSDDQVAQDCHLDSDLRSRYLDHTFTIEGQSLVFQEDSLRRCQLVYGKAIAFATQIFRDLMDHGNGTADFEISIDETMTPTTPLQHFFVANELKVRGVKVQTLAPRFCGEFQKGVDYVGDLQQFEAELQIHAAIARYFGYKLSIHSGSDKFSVFPLIGKYTQGHFHVKTAGTNWLEAMRVVAMTDPKLYREIHAYALSVFDEARKYYHVTTRLDRIPDLQTVHDDHLSGLFDQNDARQLIHITYGLILGATQPDGSPRFRQRLYSLWRNQEARYFDRLEHHIGRHIDLLLSDLGE